MNDNQTDNFLECATQQCKAPQEEDNLLTDIFQAYLDARRNKRNSKSQRKFEFNCEKSLVTLYKAIKAKTYRPARCYCFIIFKPVKREVFASFFIDRVVHHLLFNYIAPLFERQMIFDSYSCRKEKGTLKAIKRFDHHIRSCTASYTKPAYILKLDLKGYFMSIDKELLFSILQRTLNKIRLKWPKGLKKFDVDLVEYLIRVILFRNPADNCIMLGSPNDWNGLPASKSLFGVAKGRGLPIGDLTSQLFSNIFMNEFDQFVKGVLKCKHYGRYVDDFYIVDNSKEHLQELIPIISTFLKDKLHLTLHPKKIVLEPCSRGVLFVGGFVKPYHKLPNKRVLAHFIHAKKQMEKICAEYWPLPEQLQQMRAQLNSYVGYMGNFFAQRFIMKQMKKSPLRLFLKYVMEALNQIDIKNYPARFALLKLPTVKVGISFDTKSKTLKEWKIA